MSQRSRRRETAVCPAPPERCRRVQDPGEEEQGPRSLTSPAASQDDWGWGLEAVHDAPIKHDENLNVHPDLHPVVCWR